MRNDDFTQKVKDDLAKRSTYICNNPDCRKPTLMASETEQNKSIYFGKVAHITAASSGGPRFDPSLTSEQRCSANNGIFLCSNCSDLIDKNNGADYSVERLHRWKTEHEEWIKLNSNKKVSFESPSEISGNHEACGSGVVSGIYIESKAVIIKPGTTSRATGSGDVAALRITGGRKE